MRERLNAEVGAVITRKPWLTAYQILAELSEPTRKWLLGTYGIPGEGCGHHYSAASRVAKAASQVRRQLGLLRTRGLTFEVAGATYKAGGRVAGVFA